MLHAARKFKGGPSNPPPTWQHLRNNPYIHRLIEDAKLRDNVAYGAGIDQERLRAPDQRQVPAKALLEDKKLQADLAEAIEAVREATLGLTEAPASSASAAASAASCCSSIAGATLALAVSEKLRSKVLDTLFGAEEEFQYTPPAGPAADAAGHSGDRGLSRRRARPRA